MSSRPERDSLKRDAGLWSGVQRILIPERVFAGFYVGKSENTTGICSWEPRDDPGARPAGSSEDLFAGRLPRLSHRTPELAWSFLHTDRGCQGQKWSKNGEAPISMSPRGVLQ
jgi:hypothetical protein